MCNGDPVSATREPGVSAGRRVSAPTAAYSPAVPPADGVRRRPGRADWAGCGGRPRATGSVRRGRPSHALFPVPRSARPRQVARWQSVAATAPRPRRLRRRHRHDRPSCVSRQRVDVGGINGTAGRATRGSAGSVSLMWRCAKKGPVPCCPAGCTVRLLGATGVQADGDAPSGDCTGVFRQRSHPRPRGGCTTRDSVRARRDRGGVRDARAGVPAIQGDLQGRPAPCRDRPAGGLHRRHPFPSPHCGVRSRAAGSGTEDGWGAEGADPSDGQPLRQPAIVGPPVGPDDCRAGRRARRLTAFGSARASRWHGERLIGRKATELVIRPPISRMRHAAAGCGAFDRTLNASASSKVRLVGRQRRPPRRRPRRAGPP